MPDWWSAPCRVPDALIETAARERQLRLTKPPGSLGRLEEIAIRLAGLQGTAEPAANQVWISVFAGDHGVAEEGVSAFPQAVTAEMLRNFASGGAAVSVLACHVGATLEVVNLGTVADPGEIEGVRRAILAPSTANFCHGPAMTKAQLEAALKEGQASAMAAHARGAQLFIGGEMGIANTTAASALASALLQRSPEQLSGAGTGLDSAGIRHKAEVVARALAFHHETEDPAEWLRCVGGFEMAALSGAFIAAAQLGVPVLVDGFITSVAALAAVRIQPDCRDWMLFGHRSNEAGHGQVLEALNAEPLLDLGMRLGEGSGAATAVTLVRAACALHNGMATFDEAGVSEA